MSCFLRWEAALSVWQCLKIIKGCNCFCLLWKRKTVRSKRAECEGEGGVKEAWGGLWDGTRHIPGRRPGAVRYENDTAVPALTSNDRTGQHAEECSPSACLSFCLSLWCRVPLSPVLGKHLLSALGEFLRAFRSLWPPLFHTHFLWLVSLWLSVWCVNRRSLRFDRLTRIRTENISHMWHASANTGTRLRRPSARATKSEI